MRASHLGWGPIPILRIRSRFKLRHYVEFGNRVGSTLDVSGHR
jgi:hypothetical protein